MTPSARLTAAFALTLGAAAPAAGQHVSIPFLAASPQPGLIAYEGAECDVAADTLSCRFQQVFLTTENAPPETCMVTTNAYDRVFRKDAGARWVSRDVPTGACGAAETVTLEDRGGVRWTMTVDRTVAHADASPECRSATLTPEILSWEGVRRALPCRFVQPGALQR